MSVFYEVYFRYLLLTTDLYIYGIFNLYLYSSFHFSVLLYYLVSQKDVVRCFHLKRVPTIQTSEVLVVSLKV